ncbi:MAG: hypothetical protein ACPGOV_11265 [Magnetovibrionaceae bacterium]
MATKESMRKWRDKHRYVKKQLNVMARASVHRQLEVFGERFNLRGKGEAVTLAAFVTEGLMQRAEFSAEAARLLDDLIAAYHENREDVSA